MKYKLVILDWDGTVMDTVPKIVNTINRVADQYAIPRASEDDTKSIIGLSLETALETLFPADAHRSTELAQAYKHIYKEVDSTPTKLFDGVEKVLKQLVDQGVKIAVATGKSRQGLNRLMVETGLESYFITTRTADEAQSKPSPDMLNQIITELSVAPKDAVMIGDTTIDMEMARQAGIDAIGVTLGVATSEQLEATSAMFIADEFEQLIEGLT
ncbi:HAD-IA family hydrolase [Pseudoalteromonas luteoviolacea]|uniref:HAD-IA family hydrolase n=1 Tax=Pseudoalteromonas luteoviolacea TaxID=43657 RepID=UPI001B3714E3|nr:HAD-IA family hydrolase [Pseudoalteromonas luteoviolacea]MBQ4810978.1 HAD-IA family hydrolase [Pseudoalteromonas luteoviolacea]